MPGQKLLLNWTGFRATRESLAFAAMNAAESVDQYEAAVAQIEVGTFNWMSADVDDISYQTFGYSSLEEERERGGLDWKMLHAWIGEAPLEEGDSPADAFPSPIMIGKPF